MKRITRREFHLLAAAGAIAGAAAAEPLTSSLSHSHEIFQAQATATKPPTKLLLTAEQEKKVQEKIAEREQDIAALRNRMLPYNLEPAFVFHVRPVARRATVKG